MASSASVDPASASASQRAADESDLDPAAFLKSVRELSEKREREDVERYRKLEEEIERSRQERAVRKAERARSISPQKGITSASSTRRRPDADRIGTPPPLTPTASSSVTMDTTTVQPPSPTKDVPVFKGFGSSSASKSSTPATQSPALVSETPESASMPSPSATSLARSGTLSWQQRPSSRGTSSRPRSIVSQESSPMVTGTASNEMQPSRDQIAASLGSRDPSWFKQTADRGLGNAAFRRNQDETSAGDSFVSGRRGLLGMQREPVVEPARQATAARAESVKSDTPSRAPSVQDSAISSSNFSTSRTSTSSKTDLKSLIAEDEGQSKASPMSEQTSSNAGAEEASLDRAPSMSSSQARLAGTIERSSSPTKGMGGFVQSAMMKRSDSVTKRWSAQPSSSLSRQESLTGARGGSSGLAASHSMPKLEPTSRSKELQNEAAAKPSLSSSNLTSYTTTQEQTDDDVFAKPSIPSHNRSKSVASTYSTTADEGHTSPPSSPSKRWSPTKSTWLESAITKPESPKPTAARNSQPSWMQDIAKAKAQRASADINPHSMEESTSRSASPTKEIIGQGILKRPESRDLSTPRPLTTKPGEMDTPRASSPVKSSLVQNSAPKPDLRDDSTAVPSTSPASPKLSTTNEINKPIMASETKDTAKSPPPLATTKPKPETPAKPQTDFRSTLRSRPQAEAKQQDQPEFLSKFGALRKTATQNYVAPDVLKGNITRGKADLTKTDGPVKTVRKDELKESLLAKKDQWKSEKEQGIVHERKVSQPPITPSKPEALAKRELLGKSDAVKAVPDVAEKPKTETPEALARHRSLKEQAKPEPALPQLTKQTSAPSPTPTESAPFVPKKQTSTPLSSTPQPSAKANETSKLAARFNPGLAGVLVRGPTPTINGSDAPSRSESPAMLERSAKPRMSAPSEPLAEGGQLEDMRKGRAKGPKKRKGGATESGSNAVSASARSVDTPDVTNANTTLAAAPIAPEASEPISKPKPRAPPGSAASLMLASLQKPSSPAVSAVEEQKASSAASSTSSFSPKPAEKPATLAKSSSPFPKVAEKVPAPTASPTAATIRPVEPKPATPAKPFSLPSKAQQFTERSTAAPAASQKPDIPEFRGFSSAQKPSTPARLDDDKENAGAGSPSVKSSVSQWGKPSSTDRTQPPSQIQLPSRRDEEAAMRSAGLLARSPSRPGSSNGLAAPAEKSNGIVQTPPTSGETPSKPTKSSSAVSGQLRETSPNKGALGWHEQPKNDTARQIASVFGSIPTSSAPLSIDTQATINSSPHPERIFKTMRKSVQIVNADGSLKELSQDAEYTFFDEAVYICTHSYTVASGPKKTEMFLWAGEASSGAAVEQAETTAKRLAKDVGNAPVSIISQSLEPAGFLQALGGILVTRKGSAHAAPKQYMLRGCKHLGQIVFDEVDFGTGSLCSGFPYLISYPIALQETRLYLWKGSACSGEEIGAARLAAADLSETREVIEVDDGAEFSSFLKIFGAGTTKSSIPKPAGIWRQKAEAPDRFVARLFRIQPTEAKTGIFSNMFTRRPSWGNLSPARKEENHAKLTAKEISPFTQSDLEADCIYLLDAHSSVYILVGPMFASQPEAVRNLLLCQTLLFASDYTMLAASTDDRPSVPKAFVILSGVPQDLKLLFRHWDENHGLWGTGGLMAGSSQAQRQERLVVLGLDEVIGLVHKA